MRRAGVAGVAGPIVVMFLGLAPACSNGGPSYTGDAPGLGDDAGTTTPEAATEAAAPGFPHQDASAEAAPSVCGDNTCAADETCITCSNDCGQCPSCSAAPSCSVGLALPSSPQTLTFGELSEPIADADAGGARVGYRVA